MKAISISKLSAGSGTGAAIEKGRAFIITNRNRPVAIYRPYKEGDEGERINAAALYELTAKYVAEAVVEGKSVIVLKRGEPFATLCPYEQDTPKAAAKPRKRRKPRKKPTSRTEAAATTVTEPESPPETAPPIPPPESTPPPAAPPAGSLQEAIEILRQVDMMSPKLWKKLLELGITLQEKGKLEQGIALLEVLKG